LRGYLGLIMGMNFYVDLLLLLGTNQLAGFPSDYQRLAVAAGYGAVYSGACMLREFRFLGNLCWRLVSLGLIAVIAFGLRQSTLKRGGVFMLLSLALGGIALSIGRSDFPVMLLSALGIWLLCAGCFGAVASGREYTDVVLTYGDRRIALVALRDTGNTLKDPVTGEQVLVISGEAASKLTGLTRTQLLSPLETLTQRVVPGLRLIPYRAVGHSCGMLLGMRIDQCSIGGRQCSAVVAFAPEGLGREDGYQALTGGAQ